MADPTVLRALSYSHAQSINSFAAEPFASPEQALEIGRLELAMISLQYQEFKPHRRMQLLAKLVDGALPVTFTKDPAVLAWSLRLATTLDEVSLAHILAHLEAPERERSVIILARRSSQVSKDLGADRLLQEELYTLATESLRWHPDLRDIFNYSFKGQSLVAQKLLATLLSGQAAHPDILLEYLVPMTELSAADRLALLPLIDRCSRDILLARLWRLPDLQPEVRQAIANDARLVGLLPWKDIVQNAPSGLAGQYALCLKIMQAHKFQFAVRMDLADLLPAYTDPTFIIASLMGLDNPEHPVHAPFHAVKFIKHSLAILANQNYPLPKELFAALLASPSKEIREQGAIALGQTTKLPKSGPLAR